MFDININWKKEIDPNNVFKKAIDEKFRLFAHNEFYRLYADWVPMDTGMLAFTTSMPLPGGDGKGKVEISAEYIRHKSPYAAYQYYGEDLNHRIDLHPKATAYWDKVAMQANRDKLIQTLQKYIESRR